MKYDLNNKSNRFAQRTLLAFSSSLMEMLEKKEFEKITVGEICEACNYPRATFYNYFDSYRERLQNIMMFNTLDGALVISCSLFVKHQTNRIMMDCPLKNVHPIPHQLMAEHYSNTLQLIIEWCFLRKKIGSKEDALKYLRYLLKNI